MDESFPSALSWLSYLILLTVDTVSPFNDVYRPRYLCEYERGRVEELSVPDQVLGFLAAKVVTNA